jgi:hypothetical protein
MVEVAAFVNLEQSLETDKHRLNYLNAHLPNGYTLRPPQYGAGDFDHYLDKAKALVGATPIADVFFASCWNTLHALDLAMTALSKPKPIVYAGMVVHKNAGQIPSQSTGIRAFDIDDLCPYWPALLKKIKPSMTQAWVVHDNFREATRYQYDVIRNHSSGLNIKQLVADDGQGNKKRTLYDEIKKKTSTGDGLIVTACTVPALLRDDIGQAIQEKKLIAICPERMYVQRINFPCLMSYGPNLLGLYERAATNFIPNVFGAALPNKEINKSYELVVNSTVATTLGITVSNPVMVTVNGVPHSIPWSP